MSEDCLLKEERSLIRTAAEVVEVQTWNPFGFVEGTMSLLSNVLREFMCEAWGKLGHPKSIRHLFSFLL